MRHQQSKPKTTTLFLPCQLLPFAAEVLSLRKGSSKRGASSPSTTATTQSKQHESFAFARAGRREKLVKTWGWSCKVKLCEGLPNWGLQVFGHKGTPFQQWHVSCLGKKREACRQMWWRALLESIREGKDVETAYEDSRKQAEGFPAKPNTVNKVW